MRFGSGQRGKKKGEEGYGRGQARIASGDDVLLGEEEMVQRLLACIEAPDYRPPALPAVAVKLLELSRLPEVDFADVVRLLEQDSLIAGRILKLCRSAVYAGAAEIGSLHDALVRLGLRTLRDIVMEISMNTRVFRSADYAETMELLRRHATLTARVSKIVGEEVRGAGEYAFMAGLLHDVGIAGTLLALSERKGPGTGPPDLIAIWPALDRVHQRAGELMATHWDLPEDIRTAIAAHHQVLVKGEADPLAAIVCLANEVVHELGFGVIPKEEDVVPSMTELEVDCVRSHTSADRSGAKTLEHARAALQLDDDAVQRVREAAGSIVEEL